MDNDKFYVQPIRHYSLNIATIRRFITFLWFTAMVVVAGTMPLLAQKAVTFTAKDGLLVTADLYESDASYPYLLLFHQAGSSRGEFREIAPRLTKLGYNCLAVDLRAGNENNFVVNQTSLRAKEQKMHTTYLELYPICRQLSSMRPTLVENQWLCWAVPIRPRWHWFWQQKIHR